MRYWCQWLHWLLGRPPPPRPRLLRQRRCSRSQLRILFFFFFIYFLVSINQFHMENIVFPFAEDEAETKHLEALEGAETRLRLFQLDLLDYASIAAAVSACSGVFHLASPCIIDQVHEPEKELLDPAIKGTINVLTAAKEAGVRRVVVTSSISSIVPNPQWPSDVVISEDCWTDIEYCNQKKVGSFFFFYNFFRKT